ncbi:MAG: beta-N-acetylhexosaminidase [Kiritimatiellae bacterium]|nr:beta-N-acetylhexosaminidase [Kiritimatiellia bacterium]
MIRKMMTGAVAATAMGAMAAVNVIPLPNKVVEGDGALAFANPGAVAAAVTETDDASLPAEGYRLTVSDAGIRIAAADAAGRFYARQTLRQLTTPDGKGVSVPFVTIEDAPRFKWRGLHFDDCRHFFGKETLKKTLDAMAYHKLNVLHWHLTEDQGWRIEIKKYPELTVKGAVRPGSPKPRVLVRPGEPSERGWVNNHIPYGPYFYTQDDVREIVAYAAARHITIVPEIELPGHALAAIAAYPELGCTGETLEPWWRWGVSEHIFCGGSDRTIRFLEDVLDEVCDLFPGPIVHIGGDEAPKKMWKQCAKCQARIKDLGLDGEEGLQGWMTRHFTDYLAAKGRRTIGWDEVLDGNPGAGTIIMSWRGPQGGIQAAARGHDVVMCPIDPCYIDNPQGLEDDPYEYINYGFNATLERCYGFDPAAGIPEGQHGHVLGGQGNNWSEYTWSGSEYEWKMWPRMSALAECLWTARANKSWASFRARIPAVRTALIRQFRMNAAPIE